MKGIPQICIISKLTPRVCTVRLRKMERKKRFRLFLSINATIVQVKTKEHTSSVVSLDSEVIPAEIPDVLKTIHFHGW